MEVPTLVAWSVFWQHALALVLVWASVATAGYALLRSLRVGLGIVCAPLLGVVYWTLALYLLPFAGGLDVAAGLLIPLICVDVLRYWRQGWWMPAWRRFSWGTLILLIGSLPYTTTLWFHYLPSGMDGSMHATAATLIARSGGLPANHAPFAPDVPFPPVNLGLPAVAAVAIRCGGEAAAVLLATHHLTFTCLILATYVLLRGWTSRIPAAVLAVASVWLARASQASLGWGGFPNVLSVAVGILAARLLLQHARSCSWRLSLTAGAAVAAIPLIHGVGAGTWIYCAGIWIILATLCSARSAGLATRGLAFCGLWAGVFLLAYRLSGNLDVKPSDMAMTREFVQKNAPREEDWHAWTSSLDFVRKNSGSVIVLAGWGACLALAFRRQWKAVLILGAAWLALTTAVANSRWYVLPASFLLYPDRVIYWSAPLSAVGLALAWKTSPASWRQAPWPVVTALGLLGMAAYFQSQFYQKIVREEYVDADRWEALVWARGHLDPRRHFVNAPYNTSGAYLPAVAMIGCTGAHHHHFVARQVQEMHAHRACTHRFAENASSEETFSEGKIVFRNHTITIVEMSEQTGRTD